MATEPLPVPAEPVIPQAPGLDVGVTSSAADPNSPNHDSSFSYVIPNTVQLTKQIYDASKPPAVQALLAMVPGPARYQQALNLAMAGYTIDVYDDAIGNDPVVTMILRTNYGIPWTAPMLTASPLPTPTNPAPWPSSLPAGWIKTSLNPIDYPPYPIPVAPVSTIAVGNFEGQLANGSRIFGAGPAAFTAVAAGTVKDGQAYTEGGIEYTAHVTFGLMGESITFSIP
jgi:hypothetical protein